MAWSSLVTQAWSLTQTSAVQRVMAPSLLVLVL
jgi:hypothetical protein